MSAYSCVPIREVGNLLQKSRKGVLGISEAENKKSKEADIKNYAKYILREGVMFEKRELLVCLRSKLVLKNRILELKVEN